MLPYKTDKYLIIFYLIDADISFLHRKTNNTNNVYIIKIFLRFMLDF